MSIKSPLAVVQAQLDAYNGKDIEALLNTYAFDAEQYTLHGERLRIMRKQRPMQPALSFRRWRARWSKQQVWFGCTLARALQRPMVPLKSQRDIDADTDSTPISGPRSSPGHCTPVQMMQRAKFGRSNWTGIRSLSPHCFSPNVLLSRVNLRRWLFRSSRRVQHDDDPRYGSNYAAQVVVPDATPVQSGVSEFSIC